jgi:hypothetical protein
MLNDRYKCSLDGGQFLTRHILYHGMNMNWFFSIVKQGKQCARSKVSVQLNYVLMDMDMDMDIQESKFKYK